MVIICYYLLTNGKLKIKSIYHLSEKCVPPRHILWLRNTLYISYVWTCWSKYITLCMDLDTFIILCRGVYIQSTSNLGTLILRFWRGVVWLFKVIHHDLPDFLRIFWITMWINVDPMIYMSGEAHEWILIIKFGGPLSEATRPTLWALSTFNQLKHYPIMFQCGDSVTESCSALIQHWVLDMNSRTF